ncbi:URC4/urg3 family protein [Terrihabitans sp. B22-R8]|uniref:URC4/urg3 family protein n=1 Tax=Terrihabitans sp. B22-R8 TaxID=3425128 RepID=UPI00403C8EFB
MPANLTQPADAIAWLKTPEAIRQRCHALLALGEAGTLGHFTLHLDRMEAAADFVADVIRANYPALDIPYHSRWRHFTAGGIDRWSKIAGAMSLLDVSEIARMRFDLCVPSVLLDAGAGPNWAFEEPGTGLLLTRSEGLAVASLHGFVEGAFSSDPHNRLLADAAGLEAVTPQTIEAMFHVRADNPLLGVPGRADLMHRLGEVLRNRPDIFGPFEPRIGHMYDHIKSRFPQQVPATAILETVLDAFGPIWPSRVELQGENLGDVWRHSQVAANDLTDGLVPFHKLSQWLTYSLIEIFQDAGDEVTDVGALTGLPEYRNGGLFIDLGVITLRDPALSETPLPVEHEAVVEWRALTLALLDRLAPPVRARLGRSEDDMPLACVLEGGTWAAGRKIARELRVDGGPPLTIISDGTVF